MDRYANPMFLSSTFRSDHDLYIYEVVICDDEFGEAKTVVDFTKDNYSSGLSAEIAGAIRIYSDRGQSINQIAKNLWRLFEFNQLQFLWSLKEQIEHCLKHLPEYLPYHETIQMLMLFS
jgi:hypothetical protein